MHNELLKQSEIFADLDDAQLESVARICTPQALKWGEYVFREGDEGDRLYVITKGAVRISRNVPGTGEEAITILKRGACFGEMAVVDHSRRSTDAIVDTSCELLTITRTDFEALLDADRELAYKLLWSLVRLMSARLRSTNDNLQGILVMAMF